jgi:hypothetical protein
MAETAAAPANVSVKFKGKSMAKKSKGAATDAAPKSAESDRDWEAESAFRTIQDAEKHQNDPAMMKRVATHAQTQADALNGVMSKLQKQGLVSDTQAAKVVNSRKAVRK